MRPGGSARARPSARGGEALAPVAAGALARLERDLARSPRTWVLTGAAGFVGSHLLERLLLLGQRVRGVDDFSTGQRVNLRAVAERVGAERWRAFELLEGDVREPALARRACTGADLLLHQAGLGSVPRSMAEPARCLAANVEGTWSMLQAAGEQGLERAVLASSSSVYGDSDASPQREPEIGRPLSPYAASKRSAELVAEGISRCGGLPTVALRYFNVFGPRQNPDGPYAAVVPRWGALLVAGRAPTLEGSGAQSRDFTPVATVVDANLLAACTALPDPAAVINVGAGRELALARLLELLRAACAGLGLAPAPAALRAPARPGDRGSSHADITRARTWLGLQEPEDPEAELERNLREVIEQLVDSRTCAS